MKCATNHFVRRNLTLWACHLEENDDNPIWARTAHLSALFARRQDLHCYHNVNELGHSSVAGLLLPKEESTSIIFQLQLCLCVCVRVRVRLTNKHNWSMCAYSLMYTLSHVERLKGKNLLIVFLYMSTLATLYLSISVISCGHTVRLIFFC